VFSDGFRAQSPDTLALLYDSPACFGNNNSRFSAFSKNTLELRGWQGFHGLLDEVKIVSMTFVSRLATVHPTHFSLTHEFQCQLDLLDGD
jgi:hypothetical protein